MMNYDAKGSLFTRVRSNFEFRSPCDVFSENEIKFFDVYVLYSCFNSYCYMYSVLKVLHCCLLLEFSMLVTL